MADALWMNASAGAPEYNARELRRAMAALLYPHQTLRFGARHGVRPGVDDAVTLSGTTWTVQNVTAVLDGSFNLTGPYVAQLPEVSGELDPADGSNDRIDAIDLQVQDDDEDLSGFRRVRPVYVAGTPATSPTAPPLSDTAFRMATILVFAGGSPSPALTYVAPYTVASGGILPIRDDTERPTQGRYHGQFVYRQDFDELQVFDGSTWRGIGRPDPPRIASGTIRVTPTDTHTPSAYAAEIWTGFETVTFPPGLFTSEPRVITSLRSGAPQFIINTAADGVTTSQADVGVVTLGPAARDVHWLAVQTGTDQGF